MSCAATTRATAAERSRRWRAKASVEQKWQQRERARAWARQGLPTPTRPEPSGCEICGQPPSGRDKSLSLDHDHKTGKFRGWLCRGCNRALGFFGDTLEGVLRAAEYLRRE